MKFKDLFKRKPVEPEPIEVERAVSLEQIFQQLQLYSWTGNENGYFVSIYIEAGALYALYNNEGLLYRAGIDIADDDTVTMGPLEPVQQSFAPVNRSAFSVIRQADGRTRFFMIAATAIVNRCGEIDSTKLFDDMISRAESTGFYPTLDFYHLGEVDPAFEFGQFDFLAREDYAYIGSGLFTDGHPLTEATIRAWETDPAAWGASIEYLPVEGAIEYLKLDDSIEIAVYTAGLNTRISLLPEPDAAAWFTGLTVERSNESMDKKKLAALRSLFGDEEKLTKYLGTVKNINDDVTERGLIARQGEKTEEVVTTEETTEAPVIELDDTAIEAIVRSVAASGAFAGVLNPISDKITALSSLIDELKEALVQMDDATDGRLSALEAEEEQKQAEWVADLPAQRNVKVTYRPREVHQAEPVELTLEQVAANGAKAMRPRK